MFLYIETKNILIIFMGYNSKRTEIWFKIDIIYYFSLEIMNSVHLKKYFINIACTKLFFYRKNSLKHR